MIGIRLPYKTEVDGRTWRLHSVRFSTADGEFSTYIYAVSDEHAVAIVEEMRETLQWVGRIVPLD